MARGNNDAVNYTYQACKSWLSGDAHQESRSLAMKVGRGDDSRLDRNGQKNALGMGIFVASERGPAVVCAGSLGQHAWRCPDGEPPPLQVLWCKKHLEYANSGSMVGDGVEAGEEGHLLLGLSAGAATESMWKRKVLKP